MAVYVVLALDVLGNARDGYEINDLFTIGEIGVPDDATMRELRRIILREYFLRGAGRKVFVEVDPHGSGEITVRDARRPRIPAGPRRCPPAHGHGRPYLILRPK